MNLYATIPALKARANITRTDLDGQLAAILSNVCRQIDLWCGRHFYVWVGTRPYTYRRVLAWDFDLLLHDLLSLTSLTTDSAGDRTYATTWATTDYELGPAEVQDALPQYPYYWQLSRLPGGRYSFPMSRRGVQLTGKWGRYEVLERSSATVGTGGINASATTLPLSSATPIEPGMTLLIGSEQLYVSAVDASPTPDTATVVRGVNGTTAASHAQNVVIDVYTYPVVSESALTQAQRRFERTIGRPSRTDADPSQRAYANLDRDIQDALSLLKREGV